MDWQIYPSLTAHLRYGGLLSEQTMSKDASGLGYQEIFSNSRVYWRIWPDLCYSYCSAAVVFRCGHHTVRAVIHESPSERGRQQEECFVWLAELQLASCFASRFLFSRCQRAPLGWSALRCGGRRVLVRLVYCREHAAVTLLSQAWNLSGTFLSPSREWVGNRGLCELVLIQSDQRVSVQHC